METLMLNSAITGNAESDVQKTEKNLIAGFEIEASEHTTRRFESIEAIRDAILRGEIPRTARLRKFDTTEKGTKSGESEWTKLEVWAKSKTSIRRLYTPVWSLSLKGALIGFIAVGALKTLDTLAALLSINPLAAFLWLLVGAAIFSPKWKFHLMAASFFLVIKSGANLVALFGAWMGVSIFAAAFGATAGMVIGTIVGYLRAGSQEIAPDAVSEGSKPMIWGLAVPVVMFGLAIVGYIYVFIPAVLRALQG